MVVRMVVRMVVPMVQVGNVRVHMHHRFVAVQV